MLTEAEKEWLERRKNLCTRCSRTTFCREGTRHGFNTYKCRFWGNKHQSWCKEDFHDSAEFEARVAEKLAREICFRCPDRYSKICPKGIGYFRLKLGIASCGMKHARLATEAEMDAEKS